jgi:hypothetical protein
MIENHKTPTYTLTTSDIKTLLECITNNTYFTFEGTWYKQLNGLPMGASISGPLAILYMNKIENQLMSRKPSLSIYARYVDDIFILTKDKNEADKIYNEINNIDPNINFTIEYPNTETALSLLDFTVKINPLNNKPQFEFYQKKIRKPIFVNATSAIPLQQKRNYITNEVKRITERCSDNTTLRKNIDKFEHKLETNGYSREFIKNTVRKNRRQKNNNHNKEFFYLKIPFISNNIDNKIKRIFQKEGIPLRLAHRSLTLRNYLKTKSRVQACTLKNCPIQNSEICTRTGCVYRVECVKCKQFYIGSTKRVVHTRLLEHLKSNKSSIHQHLTKCQPNNTTHSYMIKTSIIDYDPDPINLRFLEALHIKNTRPTLNSKEEFHFIDPLIF